MLSIEVKAQRLSIQKNELVRLGTLEPDALRRESNPLSVASLRRTKEERLPPNHREITASILVRQVRCVIQSNFYCLLTLLYRRKTQADWRFRTKAASQSSISPNRVPGCVLGSFSLRTRLMHPVATDGGRSQLELCLQAFSSSNARCVHS